MSITVTAAMTVGLSEYEVNLLQKTLQLIEKNGGILPGAKKLRKNLHCDSNSAYKIVSNLRNCGYDAGGNAASSGAKVLTETDELHGDHRTITLPRTRIHTLEQLVEACDIDLNVWHVERFIANKWEVGAKDLNGDIHVEPLFQIKAFLVRKYAQNLDEYIIQNAKLRARVAKMDIEMASEKRLNKHLALNHVGADEFIEKIDTFVQKMGDLSLPYEKPKTHVPLITPVVSDGHTEDAVLLLSDTHFGDRIKREDTSGFPEFDLVIAGNRFGYVTEGVKQVLTLHRAMYPLKRLYVWLGGDIGNGILHDSPNSNELFPPAQVHFSYCMLKFALEDLLTLTVPDEQGRVVVEEIVLLATVGNHMRIDERMPHKFQAQRTLDWLIYQFVIERFKSHPCVRIVQDFSPYIFQTIRGHRHMFSHGMQVGYKNSPDRQCKSMSDFIDRVRALFDSPEWRRANHLTTETFARICIGDIHVPVSFPRLKSNGSLNGQNELGVNWTLEPIPAGQQIFGVSDSHLETWSYFLDCSGIQRRPEDFNKYGEFAREYADKIAR